MKEFELSNGEFVVLQVRKHWFVFVLGLFPYSLMMLFPFLLPELLQLTPQLAYISKYVGFGVPEYKIFTGIWILGIWTGAWGAFTRYYLTTWILTSQRIVTIKQKHFFSREVASLLLDRVQDVAVDVHGLLPSLIGYGNITVQSAGAEIRFTIHDIPKPAIMRDLIFEYIPEEPKSPAV